MISREYRKIMAARSRLTLACYVICVIIRSSELRIDATDNSPGTCDSEETEDGFCDSNDESKYLENIEISGDKFHEPERERNKAVKIFSEDSTQVEISSNDVNDSLKDKQMDSKDENKYLENIEISEDKFHESVKERNPGVKISSENSAKGEVYSSEVNDSSTESADKQMDVTDNSTNEWLGLQIPVVDGVRVSVVLFCNLF